MSKALRPKWLSISFKTNPNISKPIPLFQEAFHLRQEKPTVHLMFFFKTSLLCFLGSSSSLSEELAAVVLQPGNLAVNDTVPKY